MKSEAQQIDRDIVRRRTKVGLEVKMIDLPILDRLVKGLGRRYPVSGVVIKHAGGWCCTDDSRWPATEETN